jgi:UrcA family protein
MLTSKLASFAGLVGSAMIAITVGSGATTAFAGSPNDPISVKVSLADLNMASEAGAQTALARIRFAANQACGGDLSDQTLGEQMQFRSCAKQAVQRAVASINQPALTAVSQGRHVTTMASANH